jgi:hypothetical protein
MYAAEAACISLRGPSACGGFWVAREVEKFQNIAPQPEEFRTIALARTIEGDRNRSFDAAGTRRQPKQAGSRASLARPFHTDVRGEFCRAFLWV